MTDSISVGQNLKATLVAQSPEQFDALKQVGIYYRLIRGLRSTGWENLFWGGVTLWLGMSALYPNIFTQIQSVLGIVIIAQSLWAIIRPSTNGFLALTSVLLFCGLWNLFLTVRSGFAGFSVFVGLLGAFQLWWAYRTYRSYNVLSQLPTPDAELVAQYDTIWQGLTHPSPTLSPELLIMQLNRNRYWWNGILLPDHAILAHKRQKLLLFVSKAELIIVAERPKVINRNKFGIFAQIGNDSWVGKVYRNGFQQYLQWKGISDAELAITPRISRMRRVRQIAWWIMLYCVGTHCALCRHTCCFRDEIRLTVCLSLSMVYLLKNHIARNSLFSVFSGLSTQHSALSTIFLLFLLAACQPITPTPAPLPQSAWGSVVTVAQAEQSDAPALYVDENGIIAAWVGADEQGVFQSLRTLNNEGMSDSIHAYRCLCDPMPNNSRLLAMIGCTCSGWTRMSTAKPACLPRCSKPNLDRERELTILTQQITRRYTLLPTSDRRRVGKFHPVG